MPQNYTETDRAATKATHKFFWEAMLVDSFNFVLWLLTRPAALFVYNVVIPFLVAFGLQAIITKQFSEVNRYALLILLAGLTYCTLWSLGGVAICKNGKAGTEYLQETIFSNFLNKDYEFYSSTYLGSLGLQATSLKEAFNQYCTLVMNSVVRQAVIVISSIAIIAYQSLMLAVITLISMSLILSFTIASGRWRLKYRRLLSEANSEVAGIEGDALGHGTTVKSFAAEDYEKKRFKAALKKQTEVQYWSWMSSIPSDVGRMLLAAVATLVLLILTARLYKDGSISIAIVVLVQLYVIKLVNSTQEIADLIKVYETIMSSAHKALKTMQISPLIADRPNVKKLPRTKNFDLTLTNVSFKYTDSKRGSLAVKDFSLTISNGEKVGLVGYSGSGKSTLTKLLLRFMDITEGSIAINGIDIRDIAQKELRSKIAYVPQEPLLFHRTIAENIAYGKPRSNKQAIEQAGKIAYVNEFTKGLAKGYDTLVGEKGIKLSGGQRQRVAIARALLKDAPLLVLDEATSALDSKSEQYIQKALWKLLENRTALVIAHRLSTIQRMDRIVVMDKGKIVEIGTHSELLKQSGIYADLWKHQSGGYIVTPNKAK